MLAQALLKLVGLDHLPKTLYEDPRYDHRLEAWHKAQETRNDIWRARVEDKTKTREKGAKYAKVVGHFSVWMTVFEGDSEMRQFLIKAFDGTAPNCFDHQVRPINRSGGKI